LGLQVVVKSFYSPIPDLNRIPESAWERESELAGIHLDLEQPLRYLDELDPYLAEFRPAEQANGGSNGYLLENGSYGPVDRRRSLRDRPSLEAEADHRARLGLLDARRRPGLPRERAGGGRGRVHRLGSVSRRRTMPVSPV
jgi:hypothetical protein